MSWQDVYNSKLMSAGEAVSYIRSNERVVIGHACGEPVYLVDAMADNAEQYENVEIVHMVPRGRARYCEPGMEKHFRHNALFVGGATREAVAEGRADYTPVFLHQSPRLFTDGTLPVDVAMIQATPPDENGDMSLGVSVDYTLPAARAARKVIVQVNKNMPRTCGESCINSSSENIVAFVEHDAPIIELDLPKIGDAELAIGKNCSKLINDGDTLQLGIGAIPDAVLHFLTDKKDLGIHSEMISDGVVDLYEAGVITNAKKTTHPGKCVVTFLMGTRRLYDFADNNPVIEMHPADYVNNPVVIMKEDNFVAINSCVQVDLMGQAASESIGPEQISGTGGQVDFARGAAMSKNGRSILAFPSTAVHGTVSRIVPLLDEGAAVTTSRNDIDYCVTEYGIAKLSGKTLRDRAHSLIQIAHPDFRDDLIASYEKRFHCTYR